MFGLDSRKRLGIGAAVVIAAAAGAAAIVVHASATNASVTTAQSQGGTSASTATIARTPAAPTKAYRHPLVRALLKATVKETGLAAATVLQDLRNGQTIDAIAGNKSGAVENDVLNALQTRLDKAVTAGKITKQQEATLQAKAKTRVEKLMAANLSKRAIAA